MQTIFTGIQDIQGIHDVHMLTSRSWQKTHLAQLLTRSGMRPMTWSSSHDSLGDPGTPQVLFQKFTSEVLMTLWFMMLTTYIGTSSILYHFVLSFSPNFPNHVFLQLYLECCKTASVFFAARLGLALKMPTGVPHPMEDKLWADHPGFNSLNCDEMMTCEHLKKTRRETLE